MPINRRLPKRGFTNRNKKIYQIVKIEKLNKFKKDSTVTPELLKELRIIDGKPLPVKVLCGGKIAKALNVRVQAISKQAKEKIESAGGKVELC